MYRKISSKNCNNENEQESNDSEDFFWAYTYNKLCRSHLSVLNDKKQIFI